MTDERRAIRLDRRYEEPAAFEYPWHTSSKGNPWVRVGNVVLVVSEMKFRPGMFSFSFMISEPALGAREPSVEWQYPSPRHEYEYDSMDDAKRGALRYVGVGRGRDETARADERVADAPVVREP